MSSRAEPTLQLISPLFTEQILLQILRAAVQDEQATVRSHRVSYATAPGESYLGIVYRLRAEVQTKDAVQNVSLIVKGLPANMARRKTWKIPSFFKNEVLFYGHVLPLMQDFERRRRDGKFKTFLPVPVCLWSHSDGENDFIVMLDLGTEGFAISERTQKCNTGHCEAAIEMLGHFHAVGLAMRDQEPDSFAKMTKDMGETYFRVDYEDWYKGFLKNLQEVSKDAVRKVYPDSIYVKKMEEFANDKQYKLMCEMVKPDGPFCVPNHGDAWGPNFLYRYDSADKSRPSDIRLLDFQLMRLASPVLDTLFFLYSVTSAEERDNGGWDRILKHYYDAIGHALTTLGSDPQKVYPYASFLAEVKKYGKYGFGMGIESVPISMVESENVDDLDALEGDEEVPLHNYWKVGFIQHEEGLKRVADMVKFTVDQGYI